MAAKRTVLITGCSDGGLGAALAFAFQKAGWRVFASGRNLGKLKQCEAAGLETIQLDIASDASVAEAVVKIEGLTGGALDALVNNAGAGYSLPLLDIDLDKARDLFELNVFSLLRVTRAFFPLLRKSTHGAMVINNTSGLSLVSCAMPFSGVYSASKAAAASFTEVLRLELSPFGIRVINLVTGSVKSNFADNAPKAILSPDSLYAVASERIEVAMSNEEAQKNGTDPTVWANAVVKDLSRSRPSHWIFRGQDSMLARLASLLPIGTLDSVMKKITGLDVFERKLKEQGETNATK